MVVCRLCQADIVSVTTAVLLILMPGQYYCFPVKTALVNIALRSILLSG